jgi:mono/diheme cytochrome c family protein
MRSAASPQREAPVHYPFWYVPFLTSPMVIAVVAVLHVIVAHYAVGGGLFLAVETHHAHRTRHADYLDYLHDHAWFFILVTVVYGAVTGVGIWWTIGLASPLATETLIHAFVFAWGMEWVCFVVEIAAAFAFYYGWAQLAPRTHQAMGWIYALAAWLSLVLITGITGFMLHSGGWPEHHGFWRVFFNPQFLPQVLARTGGSFLLASLYVYLHAAFRVRDAALRDHIARRSARPALLGAALVVLGGAGWYAALPASAKAALPAATLLNVMVVLLFAITVAVFVMLYLGPYRHPGWLSPGFALLLFGFGLAAVAVGEQIREAVRKPYIIYNVVMGNQILADEIPALRRSGYLEGGGWTRAHVAARAPEAWDGSRVDEGRLAELPESGRLGLGKTLYMHHCASCHATERGFSAVGHLLRGWSPEMILRLVESPEKARFFMPPWAGTPEEARLLAAYLQSLAPGPPPGMRFGNAAATPERRSP